MRRGILHAGQPRQVVSVAVGVECKPIYLVEMPGASWQLLWYLICAMDENQTVNGGWRTRAAEAMGRNRIWVGHSAQRLKEHGLITTKPQARWVKVEVSVITA